MQTIESGHIRQCIEAIVKEAIDMRASDIHIEPFEGRLRVRYRIDSVLHEIANPPKDKEAALLTKIKLLAKLDIAEKRLPQDGRFTLEVSDTAIDIRVATLPCLYGESITLRLLRKYEFKGIDQLGFEEEDKLRLLHAVDQHNGLFIVTGPTGSGKTTTLYALLQYLNQSNSKIVTVEDPIEYEMRGINQSQVSEFMGFNEVLRSVLRQAPNIIMVGEIRDAESAQIASQASLTGHMVLTSLHTDNTLGAITRLLDLGLESYVIAASLKAVLALNGIFITDEHVVSDKFSLLFSKFNTVKEVADEAKFLERQGQKARYPLFRDPIKPVWIPSKEYKKEDAAKAFEKADFVLKKIAEFLDEKYNVKVIQ